MQRFQRASRAMLTVIPAALMASATCVAVAAPPNVVLILSDDQHWSDYGFMGHGQLRTPALDRLARESLVFTRGYVPSSLCCPSLASLITGRYPHEHKIVGNDPPDTREAPGLAGGQGDFRRGGFDFGMTKGQRHGDEGLSIGRKTMEPIEEFVNRCRGAGRPFFVW